MGRFRCSACCCYGAGPAAAAEEEVEEQTEYVIIKGPGPKKIEIKVIRQLTNLVWLMPRIWLKLPILKSLELSAKILNAREKLGWLAQKSFFNK